MHSFAFKRVLLAASYGGSAAGACWYAAALAHEYDSELIVAHVIPSSEYDSLGESARVGEIARLEAEFRRAAGTEFAGLRVFVLLEPGEVAEAIPALVARHAVDLVVVGHEGRQGVQKILAPPADQEIATSAARPVLIVGPLNELYQHHELRVSAILHPTDFNPASKPCMQLAFALAQRFRAELYLLHVADNVWKEPLSTHLSPDAFCRARFLESGLPEHTAEVEPQFIVEFGDPESLILESVQRFGINLIVMGVPQSKHPALLAHLPGPLAYNVASHSSCPVLALAHRAEKEPMETRP